VSSNNSPLPTLDRVIADRVRSLREQAGWSQDRLAQRLRGVGFGGWTRNVVAALEAGGRKVHAEDLVALAMAFDCALIELIDDTQPKISIGTGALPRAMVADVFMGKVPSWPAEPYPSLSAPVADLREFTEAWNQMQIKARLVEDLPADPAELSSASRGQLERTIAKSLRAPLTFVVLAAFHLWGHSATAERDRRAGTDRRRLQHISRGLVTEIDHFLSSVREDVARDV